ncbi:EXG1 (YLR300W) and SPR1 (YOR190W) [Zygosaccharomyces parabailii]|uniref:glucan 1,3-beta-glucosidase n=1 Tax=Zygosaccharomyces bailii (strain CLIB 213 / ATCC 58445 / CBS 680 / BCRC 21525 / NBRC 1098 / NCYC 1416 / NRRL Y-2227) TaxID=1333698 RepID=A0A8J2T560_ZYGB2|nr:EXG1 (YLR300W) and SPR1 (YOR190W) [Zygosaccharomyces parabailii]CDF88171.1 BN860_03928g1_1 [Zygosaccharomyces bailii CLIB 213]
MLLSLITLLLDAAATVTCAPYGSQVDQNVQFVTESNKKRFFDYGAHESSDPMRGVNLGGWFVLEPFITPSLFEPFRTTNDSDEGIPVDEYHYTKQLGKELAADRLEAHWQSWFTEKDFADIQAMGFNLVRIPIGYWAFETLPDDPYVSGHQEKYLDQAIEWARTYGLKVWVDLHGAAGSQNGFDNSGLRDSWGFLEDQNLNVTRSVIHYMLDKYSGDNFTDTVVGVQLINEPLGPVLDMDKLKQDYYLENYNFLRQEKGRDQIVVIHDAFQPFNYWDDFMTFDQGYWGVLVDHHHYQVFDPKQLNATFQDKINLACSWGQDVVNESHWTVAGEFSAALTDCTKWLNGVGYKSRYDGTFQKDNDSSFYIGTCENNEDITAWSQERKDQTRMFLEAQLDAFELRGGWIFWAYKTENSLEWDAQKLAYNGLFPQPLDDRKWPSLCK